MVGLLRPALLQVHPLGTRPEPRPWPPANLRGAAAASSSTPTNDSTVRDSNTSTGVVITCERRRRALEAVKNFEMVRSI